MPIRTVDLVGPQVLSGLDDFGAALTRGFLERRSIEDARAERQSERDRAERERRAQLVRQQRGRMSELINELAGRPAQGTRLQQAAAEEVPPTLLQEAIDQLEQERAQRAAQAEEAARNEFLQAQGLGDLPLIARERGAKMAGFDFDPKAAGFGRVSETRLRDQALALLRQQGRIPGAAGAPAAPSRSAAMNRADALEQALADPQFQQLAQRFATGEGIPQSIQADFFPETRLAGGIPTTITPAEPAQPQTPQETPVQPQTPQVSREDVIREVYRQQAAEERQAGLDAVNSAVGAFGGQVFAPGGAPPSVQARKQEMAREEQRRLDALQAADQAFGGVVAPLLSAVEAGDEQSLQVLAQDAINALQQTRGMAAAVPYMQRLPGLTINDGRNLVADMLSAALELDAPQEALSDEGMALMMSQGMRTPPPPGMLEGLMAAERR